jgi:hypothetical protein
MVESSVRGWSCGSGADWVAAWCSLVEPLARAGTHHSVHSVMSPTAWYALNNCPGRDVARHDGTGPNP